MRVIHKYTLPYQVQNPIEIKMPVGAKILSVGNQHDKLVLWAEVIPSTHEEKHTFQVIGTGILFTQEASPPKGYTRWFLGTVPFYEGRFVLHVYQWVPSDV